MSLAIVPEIDDAPTSSHLPTFEGEEVHFLKAKLASTTNLELGDDHHRLDQTTRMLVVGRVTRIDHVIDPQSGKLHRVETFKIVEAMEVPWESLSHIWND